VLTWLRWLKKHSGWWLLASLALPGVLVTWRVWLNLAYGGHTFSTLAEVPSHRVAIVFGAGVHNNRPSAALADRIEAAAALYQAGKVQKLLMTGDNRFATYNEPGVMGTYAQSLGVPAQDIVLDYAGRRTYDSCYRARAIFQVTEAVLVTQKFHQARAAYLCNRLGIKTVGLVADKRYYLRRLRLWWEVRETLASAIAWWDINFARPTPLLGEVLPIGD
jgi:SanA protein